MEKYEGFIEEKFKVCLLNKYLYVLIKIPAQWYHQLDEFILKRDFVRSGYESCVYTLNRKHGFIFYLLLYFGYISMGSSRKEEIDKINETLNRKIEMKDLGEVKMITWINIVFSISTIYYNTL